MLVYSHQNASLLSIIIFVVTKFFSDKHVFVTTSMFVATKHVFCRDKKHLPYSVFYKRAGRKKDIANFH